MEYSMTRRLTASRHLAAEQSSSTMMSENHTDKNLTRVTKDVKVKVEKMI